MAELIQVSRGLGGVVRVTLNRPEAMNALSLQVCTELGELATELGNDASVTTVVITGSGNRAFCAGADLKERKGVTAEQTGPYVDAISGAIDAWARMPKVTLAVINGYTFGGGMELALACDLRIASDNALFALTEVKLGILPGAGGTQRLTRLLGVAKAKELILLGRRIGAPRAYELGVVMEVVPQSKLHARADAILAELAGCAPVSVAKAKEAIDGGLDLSIDDGLRLERACYDVTLFTEDRNEGLRAFAEKRKPAYKGR